MFPTVGIYAPKLVKRAFIQVRAWDCTQACRPTDWNSTLWSVFTHNQIYCTGTPYYIASTVSYACKSACG